MRSPAPGRPAVGALTAARWTAESTRRTGAIGGAAAIGCARRARRRWNRLAGSGTGRHGRRRDRLAIGRLRRHRQTGRRRRQCGAGTIVGRRPSRCRRFVDACCGPSRRRQDRPRGLLAARSDETPRRRHRRRGTRGRQCARRRRGAWRRNIGRSRRGRGGLRRRSRRGWGGRLGSGRGRGALGGGLRGRRRFSRRFRLSGSLPGRTSGPGRRRGLLRLGGVVPRHRARGRRSVLRRRFAGLADLWLRLDTNQPLALGLASDAVSLRVLHAGRVRLHTDAQRLAYVEHLGERHAQLFGELVNADFFRQAVGLSVWRAVES